MFISCDPPRVLPTFTMAARSRTASGVNIALGIPGTFSQSEGSKWLMDKLTPGNSMTCNPLSWVRYQSCVQLWPSLDDPDAYKASKKKSSARPMSQGPLQSETKAQWPPLTLPGDERTSWLSFSSEDAREGMMGHSDEHQQMKAGTVPSSRFNWMELQEDSYHCLAE